MKELVSLINQFITLSKYYLVRYQEYLQIFVNNSKIILIKIFYQNLEIERENVLYTNIIKLKII